MVGGRAWRDYLTLTFSLHTADMRITKTGQKSAAEALWADGEHPCGLGVRPERLPVVVPPHRVPLFAAPPPSVPRPAKLD